MIDKRKQLDTATSALDSLSEVSSGPGMSDLNRRAFLAGVTGTVGAVLSVSGCANPSPEDIGYIPGESDIPKPLPSKVTLAGAERPAFSRFASIQTTCKWYDIIRGHPASLSPDGKQLAFLTEISGQPQLWVTDMEGGWPRQLTFGESVSFQRWSPAGDSILYGADRNGDQREGFYLITPDGKHERELLPPSDAYRKIGAFTPDGQKAVYATTGRSGPAFDIHVIDIATGEEQEVLRGRMGLYARSISPDGSFVLLTEDRGEDANVVYLYDIAGGRLEPLCSSEDEQRSIYRSFSWTPDGQGFYLITDHEHDYAGLAFYNLKECSLRFIETPNYDMDHVKLSADGRYLAWSINEDGYSVLRMRDLKTGNTVAVPKIPHGFICGLDWAGKAPVLAISLTGPQVAGDIWSWDLTTGALRRVTKSSSAGFDMTKMVVPDPRSFTARDGTVVHGLLYQPPASTIDTKSPVLLRVHGGPTSQFRPYFDKITQYFLTRGMAVFNLNYRGSSGYGKKYARLNDRHLRAYELGDLADALKYLGGQGLDTSRAAIMGGSYGGYLTMAALTRLPDLFAAGVAIVPISDWPMALKNTTPQNKGSDLLEYGDIDDPSILALLKELSPMTHVEQIKAPIMVLHGANDPSCPVVHSDQFVESVRKNGGEVEYLRFPDEGHGFQKRRNVQIMYSRMASFLESKLGLSAF